MELNIKKISEKKGAHLNFNFYEKLSPMVIGGEKIDFNTPAFVEGTATNVGSGILVEGRLNTEILVNCSRCLKTVCVKIDTEFKEEYVKESKLNEPSYHELYEQGEIHIYKENKLDIMNEILENVILNIPMKVLCSAECRGICSICGRDLNVEQCDCRTESVDPRLAALQKWFEK
ncbi:MAG TPA: hypothetical protein DEA47_01485 [Peptococcaceae bacterium]|nr:MAG: Uncharacterized protein XD50_0193 [Clostridia bacterium 41_269]HBT20034.1 hypothetical protein [Peptococcaceae bacterium]